MPPFPGNVVTDKSDDPNQVWEAVGRCHAHAVVPLKADWLDRWAYDENLCADRNQVERFFGRLK